MIDMTGQAGWWVCGGGRWDGCVVGGSMGIAESSQNPLQDRNEGLRGGTIKGQHPFSGVRVGAGRGGGVGRGIGGRGVQGLGVRGGGATVGGAGTAGRGGSGVGVAGRVGREAEGISGSGAAKTVHSRIFLPHEKWHNTPQCWPRS